MRFDPWVGKIPWRRKRQPTPVFLPGESHGQRSLAGYSPWGRRELDTTERRSPGQERRFPGDSGSRGGGGSRLPRVGTERSPSPSVHQEPGRPSNSHGLAGAAEPGIRGEGWGSGTSLQRVCCSLTSRRWGGAPGRR